MHTSLFQSQFRWRFKKEVCMLRILVQGSIIWLPVGNHFSIDKFKVNSIEFNTQGNWLVVWLRTRQVFIRFKFQIILKRYKLPINSIFLVNTTIINDKKCPGREKLGLKCPGLTCDIIIVRPRFKLSCSWVWTESKTKLEVSLMCQVSSAGTVIHSSH